MSNMISSIDFLTPTSNTRVYFCFLVINVLYLQNYQNIIFSKFKEFTELFNKVTSKSFETLTMNSN